MADKYSTYVEVYLGPENRPGEKRYREALFQMGNMARLFRTGPSIPLPGRISKGIGDCDIAYGPFCNGDTSKAKDFARKLNGLEGICAKAVKRKQVY